MAFQLLLVISGVESPTQATEDSFFDVFTVLYCFSIFLLFFTVLLRQSMEDYCICVYEVTVQTVSKLEVFSGIFAKNPVTL